jgi:hypothetical protein
MPVEAAAITELLRVWQLCTQSQNICFYWRTCCFLAVDFQLFLYFFFSLILKSCIFFSSFNLKDLGREKWKQMVGGHQKQN